MCTVHSFPTCIKHCIQCARIGYEYLFKVFINEERNTQGKWFQIFIQNIELKEINEYFDILNSRNFLKAIEYSHI